MMNDDQEVRQRVIEFATNISGDEVYTFGSNKNITLGFGDGDDRQYPERITLKRPDHLLQRFYREYVREYEKTWATFDPVIAQTGHSALPRSLPVESMPWAVKNRPLIIQDVFMSKLSTAVLTTDPESNLYMCGHGPGGRLGVGDEQSRFRFVCIEGGALSRKKIATVALGQNHTLAVDDRGEVFSWGSNGYGQLGYSLPKTGIKDEDPVSCVPAQIFGPLKREIVIGVAASRIHSVALTDEKLRNGKITAISDSLEACSKHPASSCKNKLMSREAKFRDVGCDDSIELAEVVVRSLAQMFFKILFDIL